MFEDRNINQNDEYKRQIEFMEANDQVMFALMDNVEGVELAEVFEDNIIIHTEEGEQFTVSSKQLAEIKFKLPFLRDEEEVIKIEGTKEVLAQEYMNNEYGLFIQVDDLHFIEIAPEQLELMYEEIL